MKTKLSKGFKLFLAVAAFNICCVAITKAQTTIPTPSKPLAPTKPEALPPDTAAKFKKDTTLKKKDTVVVKKVATGPKVGIAGLNHDHIHLILNEYRNGNVNIVGIAEPDKKLWEKYGKMYGVPDSLFFEDLKTMCQKRKPVIVLGYNAVGKHIDIVETCAPMGISVMVEKPLAATLEQAKRMEFLAFKYYINLLTNYETTWYPSVQSAYNTIKTDSVGVIRKMVFHDGHQGPKEIGCSEDFLAWLTDPVLNGAGALNDFGCYGADMMTWMMKGQKPIAVTAIARHYKPGVYPKVEDDATIIVEYPEATGMIEASWNWPFGIKDMEIFGAKGYIHTFDKDSLEVRIDNTVRSFKAAPLASPADAPVPYFTYALKNPLQVRNDRSSLKNNMVVMMILDAAKRSIKEGKRIVL
ncbi:Gfo/Idh/MocA family protein [Mucilaginibacter dorajii]|uniref:Gfo/Idh/MocA family oxidoreductase n=1 Tax=Mucilaginibacter dorajii TaxID=692994 RepID=A0ABP7QBR4_9SPHI|nr:Gfo/Idh/MocA family oxidoreductase [Mucilaginibacter dorajii]MCS3733073.1 putative dehydrogenase [Mucilaginibacter dorajii]